MSEVQSNEEVFLAVEFIGVLMVIADFNVAKTSVAKACRSK